MLSTSIFSAIQIQIAGKCKTGWKLENKTVVVNKTCQALDSGVLKVNHNYESPEDCSNNRAYSDGWLKTSINFELGVIYWQAS